MKNKKNNLINLITDIFDTQQEAHFGCDYYSETLCLNCDELIMLFYEEMIKKLTIKQLLLFIELTKIKMGKRKWWKKEWDNVKIDIKG